MTKAVVSSVVFLMLAGTPVWAQSWEATGLVGFTPPAPLDRRAQELTDLDIRGGFTWGVHGARFFTPSWGAEVVWTEQATALQLEAAETSTDLFTMTVRRLHGNVVYRFGSADATWQPFVFGGLGATFFSADTLESETKFALDVGGGVKFFPWRAIGVRAHARYTPTFLNDSSAQDFCDPFGFCQGTLQQFEFAGGVVVRF